MAKTELSTTLPLPPDQARELVLRAAGRLTQYDYKGDKGDHLLWERGFGLTNPQTVRVRIEPDGEGTTVTYAISILALADPFGFTKESCERFIAELEAHHAYESEGAALPEVPRDKRGMQIFIGSLVVVALITVCALGGVLVTVLAG